MATAGPNNCGTAETDSPGYVFNGAVPWTLPANAQGAADSAFATQAVVSQAVEALLARNFGFAVPAGSTITACQYEVNIKCLSGSATLTVQTNLLGSGQIGTETTIPVTTTATWQSTNAAGTKPTPTQINNTNFAVCVYTATSLTNTFSIDAVRVTVTYTPPGGSASIKVTRQAVMRAATR